MKKIYIIYRIENEERKLYSMTDSLNSFVVLASNLRKRGVEFVSEEVFEKDLDDEQADQWAYINSGMED